MTTKSSEEILLDEVKAEYARQLSSWTDLDRRFGSFLQLNGIILSIIFIGMGIRQNALNEMTFVLLSASVCIIISIIMLAIPTIKRTTIKEINVRIDGAPDMTNKERVIALALIKKYNIVQDDVISKHKIRLKMLSVSIFFFTLGIILLLVFIIMLA